MRNRGFVLIVVMWVLAILTVVAMGLVNRVMLDHRMAYYAAEHARAMMMARGAVQRGIVEVRNKAFNDLLEPERMPAYTHLGQPWARPGDLLAEGRYFEAEDLEGETVMYTIQDAERYINVNACPREMLEEIPGLSRNAVKKIWSRRTEPEREDEGIAFIHAIEELRYMRGVEEEDWMGTRDRPGLRDLATVYGYGKINFNTASREVLSCVPRLSDTAIEAILQYRSGPDGVLGSEDDTGFRNYMEVEEYLRLGAEDMEALRTLCTYNSTFFIITGVATRQGGKVRAQCTAVVEVSGNAAEEIAWKEEPIGAKSIAYQHSPV